MSKVAGPATLDQILNGPKPKMVGRLEFSHKTAPQLVLMTPEQAKNYDKATRRPGYGTCLRRISGR